MRTFPFLLALTFLSTARAADEAPPADAADADVDADAEHEPTWDIDAPHGTTHTADLSLDEGTWMGVSEHGETLVFDLLGDIWTMPARGGTAIHLTSGPAWDCEPQLSPDGTQIAYVSDAGGNENVWIMGVDGSQPRQLTHEDEARVTDPVWDPTGPYMLVRRRTVDTRSIGVTELWQVHLDGGEGFALTSKDRDPHAGETATDGRYVYYSTRHGRFEYNGDPVAGLWHIARLDRRTGDIESIVSGAGSAARPTLSPDHRELAFISRDRTKTLLEIIELSTGRRRVVADWLDHDQLEGFALHGVYPAMAWGDDGLVLWAAGKLWRVDPATGARTSVPFRAQGQWTLRDVSRQTQEIPPVVQAKVLRWPTWNQAGDVAFSALGELWIRRANGDLSQLSPDTGYAPAWSPDGRSLAWTSMDDKQGGRLHITRGGHTETLPVEGQLVNPAWDATGKRLLVLRGVGGGTSVDLGAEPWFELLLLEKQRGAWTSRVVTSVSNRGSNERAPRPFLHDDRAWFLEDRPTKPRQPSEAVLVSVALDGTDKRTQLVLGGAEEIVPSPDFSRVAFKLDHNAWVTALPNWGGGEVQAEDALPRIKLSEDVGSWLGWTPDGQAITWAEGPTLVTQPLAPAGQGGLDEDADRPEPTRLDVALMMPQDKPSGVLALTHARTLTMADPDQPDQVIDDATILIDQNQIRSVTQGGAVPAGARELDCSGKTVIPGLIDVHAHLHYSSGDVFPQQEWRYQVALDFGVTTVQDPSASTDLVFTQAERVAAGLEDGPRVFSTGSVLYGALSNNGAKTATRDDAFAHVRRMKAVGANSVKVYQQSRRDQRQWYADACEELDMLCVAEGGGDLWMDLSLYVDGYQAQEHALPQAPLYADVMGLVAASHTADSFGTAYTPTLLVAYGGVMGEVYFYQHHDPLDTESLGGQRLQRHTPRRMLDRRAWRHGDFGRDGDWNFQQVAVDAAALARMGTLVTMGAHGQLQGLGDHWELWALAGPGAMSPAQALRSATIYGARYLGLDQQLGSIEAGKLADLVVLNSDPLTDIHNSVDIDFVVHNGRTWDETAATTKPRKGQDPRAH